VSPVRIGLLAALVVGAVIAGVLIARGSGDGQDEPPPRPRVSATQIERNLEHEYRCELGAPRARATCRPKRAALFACEVAQTRGMGTSTIELEVDGANYEPVPGC
jgi:hypothetical protein